MFYHLSNQLHIVLSLESFQLLTISNSAKINILAPILAYVYESNSRRNPQNNQVDEK